jgi:polyhydroxyalkanoate synthesis repressor PhaR
MLKKTDPAASKKEAVVIKKYANRRLYNTETSTYVTLDDLAEMVRNDRDFVVYDAKTGDDLTHSVLTQIIVDQEARAGGETLLPVPFLRQLIRFYDQNISKMVPGYLQFSMENFVREQEKFRAQMASAFANPTAAFEAYQEMARKNMAMFEQSWSMFAPFAAGLQNAAKKAEAQEAAARSAPPARDELAELKAQMAAMQAKIEKLSSKD